MSGDWSNGGWRQVYRALGSSPSRTTPEEGSAEVFDDTAYIFEEQETRDVKTAREWCEALTRVFDLIDEVWVFQVQGEFPEPVAKGIRDGTPFITDEAEAYAETAYYGGLDDVFNYIREDTVYGQNWEEYFRGCVFGEPESPPFRIREIGRFNPEGMMQGAYLAPQLQNLYKPGN